MEQGPVRLLTQLAHYRLLSALWVVVLTIVGLVIEWVLG